MTERTTLDEHGVLTEPATLNIQRLLPGPIERIWAISRRANCAASGWRQASRDESWCALRTRLA